MPPTPPALLAGRFELLQQIGQGSTGEVWRAYDHKRGEVVAAKRLGERWRSGRPGDLPESVIWRLVREHTIRVDHPHVVAVHGWAADDNDVVLSMQLVPGPTLASWLTHRGPLTTVQARQWLRMALEGLAAIHSLGVVHRDLTPSNLLIADPDGDPSLVIGDFGVAAVVGERDIDIVGTDGYLSPQQRRRLPAHPADDIWSLGACFAQALGATPTTIAASHPLHRVLTAMTHPHRASRPTATHALAMLTRRSSSSAAHRKAAPATALPALFFVGVTATVSTMLGLAWLR